MPSANKFLLHLNIILENLVGFNSLNGFATSLWGRRKHLVGKIHFCSKMDLSRKYFGQTGLFINMKIIQTYGEKAIFSQFSVKWKMPFSKSEHVGFDPF
ncbi:hypothetical protein XENTR_v10023461 [Xenopus tropicalis]|nr:hypothetical protein XENTR_v10023461 [Xenopus tropicalis]